MSTNLLLCTRQTIFYRKQTLPRQKLKNVRKSRFYISKNYANPCEHSEEILEHITNIL